MTTDSIRTQDGVQLKAGDRAFNYYDHKPGVIVRIDERAQPDTMAGQDSSTPVAEWSNHWFEFRHDDGTSCSLDGSRVCSEAMARRKGWLSTQCVWCYRTGDHDPACQIVTGAMVYE